MTSTTFFIIFIPILSILLLLINLLLAPHNPYQEKDSVFECGFHSFLGQNRTQFSVSFFIFALLFLLFDLEILLVYPYSVSSYTNDVYGLIIMMLFFVLLTLGFIFELGKNALSIDSKQTSLSNDQDAPTVNAFSDLVLFSGYGLNSLGLIHNAQYLKKGLFSNIRYLSMNPLSFTSLTQDSTITTTTP
jgi:NADH-ubiquinone oxidoreductase chain 3